MTQREKIAELIRLHDDAFDAAMRIDGLCKSGEGQVTLHLTNRTDRRDPTVDPLQITGVEVYAYVLGPSRSHYFDTVDEALATVRKWHADMMAWIADELADREAEAERA